MWWYLVTLLWWCGTSAIPAPGPDTWICPEIALAPVVECSCDMPHTLRCTGGNTAMQIIADKLRTLTTTSASVSLLDCTITNVTTLGGTTITTSTLNTSSTNSTLLGAPIPPGKPLLPGVALHGLVISSGELREIRPDTFEALAAPLQALGLPNNKLNAVPTSALQCLPELDRLDLSSNVMKGLDTNSFQGLQNLSFIDLSDNIISKISPATFTQLPQLRILRLRGNHLTIQIISKMKPFRTCEELDLSGNALVGPLDPYTFPIMSNLRDLQLGHNSLSSVKMGALAGVMNITVLALHHNQIDVLEDNAFSHLRNLLSLDLSHNRIVAVSGGSLAHLINLAELDLRHNFLRALTADLVLPLLKLSELRLDDNDLSIVASDALRSETILRRLTLSENPLNCDCSLTEFAIWLSNSTTLTKEDKATAVCTTPPNLENGLLMEISAKDLVCGPDESESFITSQEPPVKSRINLQSFTYDGTRVTLQWWVEASASSFAPYSCDAIFVYEEEEQNEILLESNPLRCNSSQLADPRILPVQLPSTTYLQTGHRYRYCVVLLESDQSSDELSLVLGCSDIIPLIQNVPIVPTPRTEFTTAKLPKVLSIHANFTQDGNLTLGINVFPTTSTCEINLALLDQTVLLSQKRVNCSNPKYSFSGLGEGPYRICASILDFTGTPPSTIFAGSDFTDFKSRCITVYRRREARIGFSTLDVAFVTIFLALSVMVIGLIWAVRKVLLKPKDISAHHHQCFMPPVDLDEEQQHNRYVKLQATTKL